MSPEDFAAQSFDYVIIGGGTAGLTLAARLSEDPNVTVGVLEAGKSHLGDPMVETPGLHLQLLDKPEYDWAFQTTPQKGLNGKDIMWPRGKGLGGSSAINFLMFSQGSKKDFENWVKLGNEGWGWEDVLPYYRKFEKYTPAQPEIGEKFGDNYLDPSLRGTDGPINVTFSGADFPWLNEVWAPTCMNAGYPASKDPRTGSSVMGFHQLITYDPNTGTRSYSANAFYAPNANCPNLSVCTESLVSKILFDPTTESADINAVGVEFVAGNKTYTVKVKKEVIVSAGTICSPKVLELSGIGSKEILTKHGIQCLVDNPAVGENLQDHSATFCSWEVKEGVPTAETLMRNPEIMEQVKAAYKEYKMGPLGQATTCVAFAGHSTLYSDMSTEELTFRVKNLCESSEDNSGYTENYNKVLVESFLDPEEALIQIVAFPTGLDEKNYQKPGSVFVHDLPGNYMSLAICSTRSFSRGNIHIKSASPEDPPIIDPCYFSHPIDLDVAGRGYLHAKGLVNTPPLADFMQKDESGEAKYQPNLTPAKTLEEAKKFAAQNTLTEFHPIATCSMLPKDQQGVVGTDLKVYGTRNVRVCDASIMPIHIQGNIQSAVYAIAEKGADIIKNSA